MEAIMPYNDVDWNIRKKPHTFLKKALEHFKIISGKTIVEVGTMRIPMEHDLEDTNHDCCMEGHSSILFASNCEEFHTVDIDLNASKTAFKTLKANNLKNKWNVYNGDGIKFLKEFEGVIDLLFLDAWDIGVPNYAENHLLAYQAAESKLNKQHLILIDDTDINFTQEKGYHNDEESMGGKGAILIPHLIDNKYEVLFKGRQTCLIKK